jgi:hypothetical protein
MRVWSRRVEIAKTKREDTDMIARDERGTFEPWGMVGDRREPSQLPANKIPTEL